MRCSLAQAPDQAVVVGDQLLVLVGREGPLHGGDQQPVELGALHVLAHAVVGVAQVPVAELGEALDADRSQLLVTPRKRGSR